VLVGLLYVARLDSYLLVHTLADILFVVVCLSVIVTAWSLEQFLDDDFAIFPKAALVAVAVLHIVHLVDYPGLNLISASLDPPTGRKGVFPQGVLCEASAAPSPSWGVEWTRKRRPRISSPEAGAPLRVSSPAAGISHGGTAGP
jgi:hypothetical protein